MRWRRERRRMGEVLASNMMVVVMRSREYMGECPLHLLVQHYYYYHYFYY